jgi:hypothetical protein
MINPPRMVEDEDEDKKYIIQVPYEDIYAFGMTFVIYSN